MEIIKETAFYGFRIMNRYTENIQKSDIFDLWDDDCIKEDAFEEDDGDYTAMAILENGTWILVRDGGTAVDQSGRIYARVSEEIEAEPLPADDTFLFCYTPEDWTKELPEEPPIPDTTLVMLGWTTDSATPIIMKCIDGELRIAE